MQSFFSKSLLLFTLSFALCCCLDAASAADESTEAEKDAKPKVTKLSGVFEAVTAVELSADTEHFTSLEIKRILPHGTTVKKGQNIVWFETEDIDKQIDDAETDLRLAKVSLEESEFSFKQFLETQTLDKAAAQRVRQQAQQDFDNFVQVDRGRQELTAQFNLKSSRVALDNAIEELKQLEQMYKEDDLTEESEEIVLKRAKQSVEFAQFRFDDAKIKSERTIDQTIPRTEKQQNDKLARAQMAHQKSMHELQQARQRRAIEIERERKKFQEEEERVQEMRAERKETVLRSPHDGIVLHGKLNRGKVPDKPSTMKEKAKVTAEQVIVTVVDPSKLRIRVDLDEKELKTVKVGVQCKVTPSSMTDYEMVGTVKSISAIPYAGTKYDCVVTFPTKKKRPEMLPTTGCEIEFAQQKSESEKIENDQPEPEKSKGEKPEQEKPGKKKPAKKKPEQKKPGKESKS